MTRMEIALAFAKENGREVTKEDLGLLLWPASKPATQNVNAINLINGKTQHIRKQWIQIICQATGVDANFLYETEPMDAEIFRKLNGLTGWWWESLTPEKRMELSKYYHDTTPNKLTAEQLLLISNKEQK